MGNEDVVAECVFTKSEKINSDAKEKILNRHTNRNEYTSKEVPAETKRYLSEIKSENLVTKTILFEKGAICEIAEASIESERTVLTYRPLHGSFFESIRWKSPVFGEDTRGLDIKTMELIPPARVIFGFYKNWFTANILNKLGFPKIIASENSKTYKTASGYLVLSLKQMTQEGAVNLGQILQRHWVEICNEGLAAQLTTGVSFLYPQIVRGEQSIQKLKNSQKERVVEAFKRIIKISNLPKETEFALFMRFGYPKKKPSTYSKKNKAVLE